MRAVNKWAKVSMGLGLLLFLSGCGSSQYLVKASPSTPSSVLQYQQSVEVQYHTVVQNLDQAISSEEVAISMDPHYVDGYLRLGGLFLLAGQHQASIDALRHAIELQPKEAGNWVILGQVLSELGAKDQAQVAFDRAIAINPGNWEAWDGLGFLAVAEHHDTTAWHDGEKAIFTVGEEGPTLDLMGRVLYDQGDATDALSYFKAASRIQPDWWQSYYDQARAEVLLGNVGAALADLTRAATLDPTNGQVWTMMEAIESNKEGANAKSGNGDSS